MLARVLCTQASRGEEDQAASTLASTSRAARNERAHQGHVAKEAGCGLREVREVVESLALLQNAEELDPAAATTLFPISAQSRA